jgi:hypothetical protein
VGYFHSLVVQVNFFLLQAIGDVSVPLTVSVTPSNHPESWARFNSTRLVFGDKAHPHRQFPEPSNWLTKAVVVEMLGLLMRLLDLTPE